MKTNQLDDLVGELKSLRKKVSKSAEAHEKVERKLAQVEAIAKLFLDQLDEDHKKDRTIDKQSKKDKKKAKKDTPEPEPVTEPVMEQE